MGITAGIPPPPFMKYHDFYFYFMAPNFNFFSSFSFLKGCRLEIGHIVFPFIKKKKKKKVYR